MNKLLLTAGIGALCLLGLGACGSSKTKTVTRTVEAAAEEQAVAPKEPEPRTTAPTATSIPDGTWAKGEYTPGTYRAPGGSSCWWEKLEKLGEEVFQPGRYGSEETNILVEIDSRYFKTEECGVWQKVG